MTTSPFDPNPEARPDIQPSSSPEPGAIPVPPLEPSTTNPDADGVEDLQ